MTDEEKEEFKEVCPKCGTPWSTVPRIVIAGNWVFCDPCGKKAEVLMKEEKKKNPSQLDWGFHGWGGL